MRFRITIQMSIALLMIRTVKGSFKQYTTDADFDGGTLINMNHDIHDQLQLDSTSKPFNFIWVACSDRGTVVKVDTLSGAILGEYRSGPHNAGLGNPSGIAVDTDGSVWLANWNNIGPNGHGTIVHIGLNENDQCEGRNNIPGIQTSTGLVDIKDWDDDFGPRGISTADDECIVHYTEVKSQGTSHLSIDRDNNVWVSGSHDKAFDKVKGGRWDTPNSGEIILPYSYLSVGYGGYVGLMDPNGFIWSAGPLSLLRWDTSKPLSGTNGDPIGPSIGPLAPWENWAGQNDGSDGLCIDSKGNVWITDFFSSNIMKYKSDGTYLGSFFLKHLNAQGCVVDLYDHVWVAHSLWDEVEHLDSNGFSLGTVNVGLGPTGVAVDRAGKVWSTNINDDTITRIDPYLNSGVGGVDLTVNLGGGCYPYNYGDMTGSTNIAPPNSGSWTVTYFHGSAFAPGERIEWTAVIPDDSSLTVQVKNDIADAWTPVWNGQVLNLSGLVPNLYVRVSFVRASTSGASPVLYELSIIGQTPSPTNTPTTAIPTSTPTSSPSLRPTGTDPIDVKPTSPVMAVDVDVEMTNTDEYANHYTTYEGDTSSSLIVQNNNDLVVQSSSTADVHHMSHHKRSRSKKRPKRKNPNKKKSNKKKSNLRGSKPNNKKKKKKRGVFHMM